MTTDEKRKILGELLGSALATRKGRRVSKQAQFDFIFHMTDWVEDLVRLARLYRSPESCSAADVKQAVDGLLIHGVGHIVQAARIWDHFSDPFGTADPGDSAPTAGVRGESAAKNSPARRGRVRPAASKIQAGATRPRRAKR